MADFVEAVMALWQNPPSDADAAERAFAELYTDPVPVNGTPFTCAALAARAQALNRAFEGLGHRILERVEIPGKLVIAFLMTGKHVGPLPTALGEVPATGRDVAIRTIDVLTLTEGRISEVVVVADELGLLTGINAVALTTAPDKTEAFGTDDRENLDDGTA